MPTLTTSRLLLQPLELSHLDELGKLYGNIEVMKFITGQPRTLEQTQARLEAHIRQYKEFGFGLYATYLKSNGQFIGRCGLEPRTEDGKLAGDLAWMFAPEFWRLGLGYEVGERLIEFGLDELQLHRVFATADHLNLASIAIMKKLGMKLCKDSDRGVEYEVRSPAV